jgi:hypothetical protein
MLSLGRGYHLLLLFGDVPVAQVQVIFQSLLLGVVELALAALRS